MSQSNDSASKSYLYALRMVDRAVWAFLQRKIDHISKIEQTKLKDMKPGPNYGTKYVEYMFEAVSFSQMGPNYTYYIRLWIPDDPFGRTVRVEKVLITNQSAMVLGEWDGTGNKGSFEIFLRGINQVATEALFELLPQVPPLFETRTTAKQYATMIPEMVIKETTNNGFVVQAIDLPYGTPVAELRLVGEHGWYWAHTIKTFRNAKPNAPQEFYWYQNLWRSYNKL